MASITLTLTGPGITTPLTKTISKFRGKEFVRSYLHEAKLSDSYNGNGIVAGPSYASKYLWTVNAFFSDPLTSFQDVADLFWMYENWERLRTSYPGVVPNFVLSNDTTPPNFLGGRGFLVAFQTAPNSNFVGDNSYEVKFILKQLKEIL